MGHREQAGASTKPYIPNAEGLTAVIDSSTRLVQAGARGVDGRGNAMDQHTSEFFITSGTAAIRSAVRDAKSHRITLPSDVLFRAGAYLHRYEDIARESSNSSKIS